MLPLYLFLPGENVSRGEVLMSISSNMHYSVHVELSNAAQIGTNNMTEAACHGQGVTAGQAPCKAVHNEIGHWVGW